MIETLLDFIRMGGYGAFVWPSYLLAGVILFINWWAPRRRRHNALCRIAEESLQSNTPAAHDCD